MPQDDRALLEAAARAAGITEYTFCELVGGDPALYCRNSPLGMWAPLTDDGDALRLAVKLRLNIYLGSEAVSVGGPSAGEKWLKPVEELGTDPSAATRRAIVRAAAASLAKEPTP